MKTKLFSALASLLIMAIVIITVVGIFYLQISGQSVIFTNAAWVQTNNVNLNQSKSRLTTPSTNPITTTGSCSTPLNLRVSSDGKASSANTEVSLPTNIATKYYLHVKGSDGRPCSTNFEVKIVNNGVANIVTEWGPYKSDQDGIARIDLDRGWPETTVEFAVRPKGSQGDWSGNVKIFFSSSTTPSTNTSVNALDYFKQTPGNVYIYNSTNHWYDPVKLGLTYLQIESKTNICGRTMVPWRITKSDDYAYWGNRVPRNFNSDNNLWFRGDRDFRWFIADYYSDEGNFQNYSQYIWSYGFEEYERDATLGLGSGASPSKAKRHYVFTTNSPNVPNYNLGRRTFSHLPFIEYSGSLTGGLMAGLGTLCNLQTQTTPTGFWKLRAEWDYVDIKNPGVPNGFNYTGQALRMDYYEGDGNNTTGNFSDNYFHRESYYFVKDVGLVKMLADNFNHYGGVDENVAPMCSNDSDCWADTIRTPTRSMVLKQYFNNPVFQVKVSNDNVNYTNEITISRGSRYYLKITNVSYTGWLESQVGNGIPRKWLWAENGVVTVKEDIMQNVPAGIYPARFRVWIPNDVYPNQTRVGSNNIQFSNQIVVKVI